VGTYTRPTHTRKKKNSLMMNALSTMSASSFHVSCERGKPGESVPITSNSALSQSCSMPTTPAVPQQQRPPPIHPVVTSTALPTWPLKHQSHEGLNTHVMTQLREMLDAIEPANPPAVRQQAILKLTQYAAQYIAVKMYVLKMNVFKLLEPILCSHTIASAELQHVLPSSPSTSAAVAAAAATFTFNPPTSANDIDLMVAAIKLITECAWSSWNDKSNEMQKILDEHTKTVVFKRLCILTLQCPMDTVRIAAARALWNLLYRNSVTKQNASKAFLNLLVTNIITPRHTPALLKDMCLGIVWALVEDTSSCCQVAVDAGIVQAVAHALNTPPTTPGARIETYFLNVSLLNAILKSANPACASVAKKKAIQSQIPQMLIPLLEISSMTVASAVSSALSDLLQGETHVAQQLVRMGVLLKYKAIMNNERFLPCIGNTGLALAAIVCMHPLWTDHASLSSTTQQEQQQNTEEKTQLLQQANGLFNALLYYFIQFQRKKPCSFTSIYLGQAVACMAEYQKDYKDMIFSGDGLHCLVLLLIPSPELSSNVRQASQNCGLQCLLRVVQNHQGLQHAVCTFKFKQCFADAASQTEDGVSSASKERSDDVPIPSSAQGIYGAYFFLILRCVAKPWAIMTVMNLMTHLLPGHPQIRQLLRANHVDFMSYLCNTVKSTWDTSPQISAVAPCLSCLFVLFGGNDPLEVDDCKLRIRALMQVVPILTNVLSQACLSIGSAAPA
jgi:hypothetical protein